MKPRPTDDACGECLGTGQIGVCEGFYTTTCPRCEGTGSSRRVLVGSVGDGDCPTCEGMGTVPAGPTDKEKQDG